MENLVLRARRWVLVLRGVQGWAGLSMRFPHAGVLSRYALQLCVSPSRFTALLPRSGGLSAGQTSILIICYSCESWQLNHLESSCSLLRLPVNLSFAKSAKPAKTTNEPEALIPSTPKCGRRSACLVVGTRVCAVGSASWLCLYTLVIGF